MIESGLAKYINSNTQNADFLEVCVLIDFNPSSDITNISPGSMSLKNIAPTASIAQDSEEITYPPFFVIPRHNGLNPYGSLNAINLEGLIKQQEYAPFRLYIAISIAFSIDLDCNLSLTIE